MMQKSGLQGVEAGGGAEPAGGRRAVNKMINNGIADLVDTIALAITINDLPEARTAIGRIFSEYGDTLDAEIRSELLYASTLLDVRAEAERITIRLPFERRNPAVKRQSWLAPPAGPAKLRLVNQYRGLPGGRTVMHDC